jgi:rhamnosyltransferase
MISVVIPTLNAEAQIGQLVRVLQNQTVQCEVIVVDSSSDDKTVDMAESLNVRTITIGRSEFNHGATRNLGTIHAKGDIFVFLTQDALPSNSQCIQNLIEPLEQRSVAASYGRQVARADAKPTERFARSFNYPETPVIKSRDDIQDLGIKAFFFSNVCSAVKKEMFVKLGGFPEELIMFEDMLFAAKLIKGGYKIAYTPDALVLHSHNYGWRDQFRRYAQAGASFCSNPWFQEYPKATTEGVRFLRKEIEYLLSQKLYGWALYGLVEAFFKYSGYRFGMLYRKRLGGQRMKNRDGL